MATGGWAVKKDSDTPCFLAFHHDQDGQVVVYAGEFTAPVNDIAKAVAETYGSGKVVLYRSDVVHQEIPVSKTSIVRIGAPAIEQLEREAGDAMEDTLASVGA